LYFSIEILLLLLSDFIYLSIMSTLKHSFKYSISLRSRPWNLRELIYNVWRQRKTDSLKNTQNDKIENVAGLLWLSLYMDGTGKCKSPFTPSWHWLKQNSTFKHENGKILNEYSQMCTYSGYHVTFNVTL
jgi:hypothetical protein